MRFGHFIRNEFKHNQTENGKRQKGRLKIRTNDCNILDYPCAMGIELRRNDRDYLKELFG